MAATPRKAASVLLVRYAHSEIQPGPVPRPPGGSVPGTSVEVYMAKRARHLQFLGGFYAFPGGVVDPHDVGQAHTPGSRILFHFSGHRLCQQAEDDQESLANGIAALRELFEESGILLALREDTTPLGQPEKEQAHRLAYYRRELLGGRLRFDELLEEEHLYYDFEALHYLSHWVTPESQPVRFDTVFYVARLPDGQVPVAFSGEVEQDLWIRPQDALEAGLSNRIHIVFSTASCLQQLMGMDLRSLWVRDPTPTNIHTRSSL